MKKVSKISLYNLSKVGLSDKEMSMINGGYGGPGCVVICSDSICRCVEDGYGGYSTSQGVIEQHSDTKAEKALSDDVFEKNNGYK